MRETAATRRDHNADIWPDATADGIRDPIAPFNRPAASLRNALLSGLNAPEVIDEDLDPTNAAAGAAPVDHAARHQSLDGLTRVQRVVAVKSLANLLMVAASVSDEEKADDGR